MAKGGPIYHCPQCRAGYRQAQLAKMFGKEFVCQLCLARLMIEIREVKIIRGLAYAPPMTEG